MTTRRTFLAATTALLAAPPALAQSPALQRVATRHSGVFGGERVAYTVTVEEMAVTSAAGAQVGTAIATAYVRDRVRDPAKRPVLFAFNGGPGASSSPLHLSALGPYKRLPTPPGDRTGGGWIANPDSPLDACDLVFIDPVGTGFARPLPGADTREVYSVSGDARVVKALIAGWLKTHGREASPRYVIGESYGTTRAATLVASAPDLAFDGVLLVAMVGDTPGREMPYVAALPTMAAGAWWHRRIDRAGRTVDRVFAQAVDFARTDYLEALVQGGGLPEAARRRVAGQMSALVGLPEALILEKDLRLSKNDWMFNLLKDKGLRTGLLDVTVTAPLEPGQDGAIDDPALGVVPKRAAGAPAGPPPSPAALGAIPSPVVGRYFSEVLGYKTAETYYGVNFAVNAAWNYETRANPYAGLARVMRANPRMRLFWAAGYFDLTTPAYAGRYTLDQAGVPAGQLTAAYFAGPHGVYDHPENLVRFTGAVRDFVRPTSPG